MIGQQVYIYQKNNRLKDATVTAGVAASARTPLIYPVTKEGNGNIRVQGAFTGLEDAKYEVKITDTALTAPVVSSPIFRGAGTGKIKDVAAVGLDAQAVRVLCLSTGVNTEFAEIEIEGVRFRSKLPGADGNGISISIDDSGLVFTESDYSTIRALAAGDSGLTGQEWDWDTKSLQGKLIPATAHRLAFGRDQLNIYRQYKKFIDNVYKYYFVTPIKYPVKAGTKVFFVSGGREITVTDGITTEVYDNIVTIADFWSAIRNTPSELLEPIENSIDVSMSPDSAAVREFSMKTSSYALPAYAADGSSIYAGELSSVITKAATKTELISARCTDNSSVGAELWSISGSASGALGSARTGELNDFGPVAFTIPQKLPANWGDIREDWSHKFKPMVRNDAEVTPALCFNMRLGANSSPQKLELEYKRRTAECVCPVISFSDSYLGFEEKGGEIGMAYTIPDLNLWIDSVIERMKEQISRWDAYEGRETSASETSKKFSVMVREYVANFKILSQRLMALPEDEPITLEAILTDLESLVQSLKIDIGPTPGLAWEPASVKAENAEVTPEHNGLTYKATVAGTTGATEPVWPAVIGQTVVDGTVTWTCFRDTSVFLWDGSRWNPTHLTTQEYGIYDVTYDTDLYQDVVDAILLYEKTYGLKKNSVIVSDDGSYTDPGGEYYWEVRGDKAYLPAFTDVPYYSTVQSGDAMVSTKEFAFNISVPCTGTLKVGDIIQVTIGGMIFERTYQVGDITYLPTIASQDLALTGGIDGDDTYVWEVKGDEDSFANYSLDRTNPLAYSNAGLSFEITDGIVPFQVGDRFDFSIEGGHWKWRKGSGAWSDALDISGAFQLMDAGVEIAFDFGVAPSFVTNDLFEILCTQENRVSNLHDISKFNAWKGTGDINIAFASPVEVDTLIIDLHGITGNIVFKASDLADFSVLLHNEIITPAELICKLYSGENVITAKYFKFTLTGENRIGYIFLGSRMQLALDADSVRPLKRYNMSRQEGKEPFSLYDHTKHGYTVEHQSYIENADFALLAGMIDYLKTNDDQPLYFIANANYPAECLRARIELDNLEIGCPVDINAPTAKRLYTISLPIVGSR